MDQVTPEIKLTIENALLTNNKVLTDEFTKSLEKSVTTMTQNFNQQTQPLFGQIVDLAKDQEKTKARVSTVENNQKIRKGVAAAWGAAAIIILGVVQYLITQLAVG